MADLNHDVFIAINHWPNWMEPTMRFFTEATSYLWVKLALVALVVALFLARGRGRRAAVEGLLGFLLANGMTDLWKHLVPRARPFQEIPHEVLHNASTSHSMGTASAHSANMAVVAFVFVYHLRWWGSPWIAVALLTGLSRIYMGDHYPYQVLLGWTCGILAGFVVTKAGDQILRRRSAVRKDETPPTGGKTTDEVEIA